MKTFALITAAAMPLALAQPSQAIFTFATHGFGDTGGLGGQPYRTSDGSGFFVHSSADAGDGTPSAARPVHNSSWEGTGNDREWSSYMTHDGLGPSRRSGAPNNPSDAFYINHMVYQPTFNSRSSNLVSFTPSLDAAARRAIADDGVLLGGSFIAGPSVSSGPSPVRKYFIGTTYEGVFLARLTVKAGVQIAGAAQVIGNFGTADLVLDSGVGASRIDQPGGRVYLNSYKVATVTLSDPGFDAGTGESENFAGVGVDVYDIWVEEWTTIIPTPSAVALFGAAGLAGLRRRRARAASPHGVPPAA